MAWMAASTGNVVRYRIECALSAYSLGNLVSWNFPEGLDKEALALALSQHPGVWSDGSKRFLMRLLVLVVLVVCF